MKNADVTMRRAKELGRNCVQYYAQEMNARMLEQFKLQSGLRHAIERKEFIRLNFATWSHNVSVQTYKNQ